VATSSNTGFTRISGVLDGATINGNVNISANATLAARSTMQNGAGWTGTATVGTTGQNGGQLLLGSSLSTLNAAPSSSAAPTRSSPTLAQCEPSRSCQQQRSRAPARVHHVARSHSNAGNIVINGGTLFMNGNLTNSGTVTATGAGSNLTISSNLTNTGNVTGHTGALITLSGNFSPRARHDQLTGGGVLELTGNLNNAVPRSPRHRRHLRAQGHDHRWQHRRHRLTPYSGVLDGATINGNVNISANARSPARSRWRANGAVGTGSRHGRQRLWTQSGYGEDELLWLVCSPRAALPRA